MLVRDEVTGVCCGRAGVFALNSGGCWFHRSWEHLDLLPPDENSGSERCRLYLSVPQPLHTAPASQDGSHVGHAGVGIVSLKGPPVAMPTFATAAFRRYFDLG